MGQGDGRDFYNLMIKFQSFSNLVSWAVTFRNVSQLSSPLTEDEKLGCYS